MTEMQMTLSGKWSCRHCGFDNDFSATRVMDFPCCKKCGMLYVKAHAMCAAVVEKDKKKLLV